MTGERTFPPALSPLSAYDLAGRAMARECRELGASRATRAFEPRRIFGGWHSPLFDLVLRTREATHVR